MIGRDALLITCEHASNAIPASYRRLGLSRRVLQSHVAWDPGARAIARHLARALGAAVHTGRYSRLLIDLNRRLHHPGLIAARSFGVEVPGNAGLSREERERRVRLYYLPYWSAVIADVENRIRQAGSCVHLSVHSFAPEAGGAERKADLGLLYDPQRGSEVRLAKTLAEELRSSGTRVRKNYPYRGVSDSLVTHCRGIFAARVYVGLEIEINQRLVSRSGDLRRAGRLLAESLRRVFR